MPPTARRRRTAKRSQHVRIPRLKTAGRHAQAEDGCSQRKGGESGIDYGAFGASVSLPALRPASWTPCSSSQTRFALRANGVTSPRSGQARIASASLRQLGLGGESGIRTRGGRESTPDFESGTFGHSVTSPPANMAKRRRSVKRFETPRDPGAFDATFSARRPASACPRGSS